MKKVKIQEKIYPVLGNMSMGEEVFFKIERSGSVNTSIQKIQNRYFSEGRKFSMLTDSINGVIKVTRTN